MSLFVQPTPMTSLGYYVKFINILFILKRSNTLFNWHLLCLQFNIIVPYVYNYRSYDALSAFAMR